MLYHALLNVLNYIRAINVCLKQLPRDTRFNLPGPDVVLRGLEDPRGSCFINDACGRENQLSVSGNVTIEQLQGVMENLEKYVNGMITIVWVK